MFQFRFHYVMSVLLNSLSSCIFMSQFLLNHVLSKIILELMNVMCSELQKSTIRPVQAPQSYSPATAYLASGPPSAMYMGVSPYGSSLFNGSSKPPYDSPYSGGSAYHCNYANRISTGNPYRPLHMPGPTPYPGGSMMENGK